MPEREAFTLPVKATPAEQADLCAMVRRTREESRAEMARYTTERARMQSAIAECLARLENAGGFDARVRRRAGQNAGE